MPPRPGLSTGPCPGVAWCAVAWLAWHGERAEPAGHALHLPRAAGHRPSRLSHHLAELRFVRTSEGFSAPTSQRDLTVFTDRPPQGPPPPGRGDVVFKPRVALLSGAHDLGDAAPGAGNRAATDLRVVHGLGGAGGDQAARTLMAALEAAAWCVAGGGSRPRHKAGS